MDLTGPFSSRALTRIWTGGVAGDEATKVEVLLREPATHEPGIGTTTLTSAPGCTVSGATNSGGAADVRANAASITCTGVVPSLRRSTRMPPAPGDSS